MNLEALKTSHESFGKKKKTPVGAGTGPGLKVCGLETGPSPSWGSSRVNGEQQESLCGVRSPQFSTNWSCEPGMEKFEFYMVSHE